MFSSTEEGNFKNLAYGETKNFQYFMWVLHLSNDSHYEDIANEDLPVSKPREKFDPK